MVFIDKKYKNVAKARKRLCLNARLVHEACDAKQMPKSAEIELADLDHILDDDIDYSSHPNEVALLKFLSYMP